MDTKYVFIIFLVAVLLVSCGHSSSIPEEVMELDSLIEANPEKYGREVQAMKDKYGKSDESVRMKLALMEIKAKDKVFAANI